MSTIACPNCGKPLRAGARFCGNCGATLPAPARPAAPPPPSDTSCPHCGKPIREGARFCGSCGKAVDLEPEAPGVDGAAGEPVTPTPPAASPAVTVTAPGSAAASQQETRRTTPSAAPSTLPSAPPARVADTGPGRAASGPHPAPPSAVPGAAKATPTQARRLGLWLALVGVLACVGLLAGGYFLADQMEWLNGLPLVGSKPTTAAVLAPIATGAAAPLVASPSLVPVAASPAPATSQPTATAAATSAPTSAPTVPPPTETIAPASPTLPVAPTQSAAPAAAPVAAPQQVFVLFDDTFDNGLAGYWRTWGSPRPLIDRGPGDAWLSLKALEVPTAGGITSRRDFVVFNEPGAAIEFEAQLDSNYPQGRLLFDWDPLDQFERGPDNGDAGLIHLELRKDDVRLQTGMSGENCSYQVTGQTKHTYTLQVEAEQAVNLYVDGQASTCAISDMGLDPMAGSISFSGLGWITRVKVSLP